MIRKASVHRKTKETNISLSVILDGTGTADITTDFPFLGHMLELLARFSGVDLTVEAHGDMDVDEHHLVEDTGICLGDALKEGLGDKKGIGRFGFSSCPMDEVLVQVSLDISGRPYLAFNIPDIRGRDGAFETEDTNEFLKGFVNHAGVTLHVTLVCGENLHHVNEAIFKGLALALKQAARVEGDRLPSTKGTID